MLSCIPDNSNISEGVPVKKDTDITEAFETHHLNNIAYKTLKKYYIRDAKTPRNSPFTFKEDGFYKTLKELVREEIERIPKSDVKISDYITDGLFTILLMASTLSLWVTNYWCSMSFYLIASFTAALLVIAAHNYIHMRNNWRMYLFNMCLWSYRDFRISHALSHHLYPNTLMDLQISSFEPLVYWNPRRDKPFWYYLSFLIQNIIVPFIMLIYFVQKFLLVFLRKDFFKQHYYWHDALGLLLPIWMYLTSGASFYNSVVMWLWVICTASFIVFSIGLNASHHHPKIFKDGDEVRDVTPDWGMHQLEAVMDRPEINNNHFTALTFFGHHALHHLFPTIDHAILGKLYPVFLRHCEKYKANFRLTSQLDLFLGQIKMTLKKEPALYNERGLIYR